LGLNLVWAGLAAPKQRDGGSQTKAGNLGLGWMKKPPKVLKALISPYREGVSLYGETISLYEKNRFPNLINPERVESFAQ
jgi:hypothetical protein